MPFNSLNPSKGTLDVPVTYYKNPALKLSSKSFKTFQKFYITTSSLV